MSYYDPHRVFNHRRTAEQRKGQSIQNRLIDTVEPRVDPEVLRKAKRHCSIAWKVSFIKCYSIMSLIWIL